jgi:hypothetical protein
VNKYGKRWEVAFGGDSLLLRLQAGGASISRNQVAWTLRVDSNT